MPELPELPELKIPLPSKAHPEPLSAATPQQNPSDIPLIKPKKDEPWLELALDKNKNEVHYQLGRAENVQKKGTLMAGETLPLGWADWRLELLQTAHHKSVAYTLQPAAASTNPAAASTDPAAASTNPAAASTDATNATNANKTVSEGPPGFHAYLENSAGQRGPGKWVISGEVASLALDSIFVRVGYGLELRPIPFSIELLDFEVPRDEGTETPGDFRATVQFRDLKTATSHQGLIHMNHPASFPGGFWANVTGLNYKFSQAEWNPRNLQETTLQVLYDPGWFLKWIGSLAICIGIALMFYWNKK